MRKRALQQLLATLAGAALGGLTVFFVLARLGSSRTETASPEPTPAVVPSATPVPTEASNRRSASVNSALSSTVSPAPQTSPAAAREARADGLGVRFSLPSGYRVATALNLYEASAVPGQRFTLTKALGALEQEYVALVKSLRESVAATEAPTFAPGVTITLEEASGASGEQSDASLARARESITTKAGLTGTRYRRVEGLQTYDITYLALAAGRRISAHMAHSSEDPQFDEAAYQAVLDSLRPL